MACDEQHVMSAQDKSQQCVGKTSPNMNPHGSGFLDREVVNKIAMPGTVYIAAKTANHHPSPFPWHLITNLLFFPVYLDMPGIMIGIVSLHEE